MAKVVTHKQVFRHFRGGGMLNTTICGRQSNAGEDANVADGCEVVTCKLCLKRMNATTLAAIQPAGKKGGGK